jgi:hypothetical protein
MNDQPLTDISNPTLGHKKLFYGKSEVSERINFSRLFLCGIKN